MKRFDIKNPKEWQLLNGPEVLALDASGERKCKMTFNAAAPTQIFVSESEDMADPVLLGSGTGVLVVNWTARGTTYVQAVTEAAQPVYVRGHAPGRAVAPSDEPPFVNIAPRGRPTELQRMMYIMKLNEQRRDQQLQKELSRLSQPSDPVPPSDPKPTPDPVVTPDPEPTPEPTPAPEPTT